MGNVAEAAGEALKAAGGDVRQAPPRPGRAVGVVAAYSRPGNRSAPCTQRTSPKPPTSRARSVRNA
jgi:hypothetical protein